MNNSVLIFGANGFVGSYLTREFLDHGYDVFGSDRSKKSRVEGLSAFRVADLTDAKAVESVIKEFSPGIIVNLAAISSVGLSWKHPQDTMTVNVIGAVNILEGASRLSDAPRVLLIGSSEEYAPSNCPLTEESTIDASSPYGISKVTQEQFADMYSDRYGIPVYKARSFNHTGVGQASTFVLPSWCEQVAKIDKSGMPGCMTVGNIDVVRDFSDVRDIVRGYRKIVESEYPGQAFNLGSGHAYPLSQLLARIIGFSSQPIEYKVDPCLFRPSENPVIKSDCSKAKELLGWEPEIDIKDTLEEMYVFFRTQA